MNIGFTGTRHGMTAEQLETVTLYLKELRPTTFHHGDCVGADEGAHLIALALGIDIVLHPPIVRQFRAFSKGAVKEWTPKRFLVRNRDIVDNSDILLATPAGLEVRRSGTWSTVRYARRKGKGVIIIFPNGRIKKCLPIEKS